MAQGREGYHGSEGHLDSLKTRLDYAISMMKKAIKGGNSDREKAWAGIATRHKQTLEEELSRQGRYVY